MRIIISPAKKMNIDTDTLAPTGLPVFLKESEMNRLLGKVKGKPEENAVSTLAIRSMAKAMYSTDNIGHYGLAFP